LKIAGEVTVPVPFLQGGWRRRLIPTLGDWRRQFRSNVLPQTNGQGYKNIMSYAKQPPHSNRLKDDTGKKE